MNIKEVKIEPSKLHGNIKIPPSKSIAHRAIICAALSSGKSVIENVDYSEDIVATIEGMRVLGANIKKHNGSLEIQGIDIKDLKNEKELLINCNESGSTLRFLVPISIVRGNKVRFIGKGNLGKRPLTPYYKIFNRLGIEYTTKEDIMDLFINGKLIGGEFSIKGNISSQFISGLLFTLPLLKEDSVINITTKLESKSYIDLTLSVMKDFGVDIENNQYKRFIIKGNQEYRACNYRIEGDYSQAAFYLCASALGNGIKCIDLNINSLQGDKECINILEKMGCKCYIYKNEENIKIQGYENKDCITSISGNKESVASNNQNNHIGIMLESELTGSIIDAAQCPDIIPILTVVAALSKGESTIINGSRLRIKECDRLNAICIELNKLGANIIELKDGLIIKGVTELKGGKVHSHDDHRIAMSLAIASTRCKNQVIIENPECVKKSYPDFWSDFEDLGAIIEYKKSY